MRAKVAAEKRQAAAGRKAILDAQRRAEAERRARVVAERERWFQQQRAQAQAADRRMAAERAAKKSAEAEAQARIPQAPKNGNLREWEQYYAKQGITLPTRAREKLARREQKEFYRQVAGKKYLPKEFGKISGVGVRAGVSWMFSAAYQGETMPYWELWYDKRATASQIARMVATDYQKEIMRRVGLKAKHVQEREAWQEAGKVAPKPTIDPREGLETVTRARAPTILRTPAMQAPPVPRTLPQLRKLYTMPELLTAPLRSRKPPQIGPLPPAAPDFQMRRDSQGRPPPLLVIRAW